MTEQHPPASADDDTVETDPVARRMAAVLAEADRRALLKAGEEREAVQRPPSHVDEVSARQYEDALDRAMWTIHQNCIILRPSPDYPGVICNDHTRHRAEAAALIGPPPRPVI